MGKQKVLWAVVLLLVASANVWAQDVVEGTEELDWDRPEAWAMKWFASVTQFTALGPPEPRAAGSVDLAFEVGSIPHLDEDQRRVGYNGIKVDDLNKLPVLVRPRVAIGLGRNWSLDLAYIPPIELRGVKANLLFVGVSRPVYSAGRWTFGLRGYGQVGTVKGDYTCSEATAEIEPGAPGNEFGCEEPSNDEVTLNTVSAAVTGGFAASDRTSLYFGVAANYMDLEFQVDALTYGLRDRRRLLADGWTASINVGASWRLGEKTALGTELYYSPLEVQRSSPGGAAQCRGPERERPFVQHPGHAELHDPLK